jgi:hypothetical protein
MQDQSIERQREGQGSGDPSGLQIQYGAIDVPGGFDSHTFPPLPCFRRYPVPQRY